MWGLFSSTAVLINNFNKRTTECIIIVIWDSCNPARKQPHIMVILWSFSRNTQELTLGSYRQIFRFLRMCLFSNLKTLSLLLMNQPYLSRQFMFRQRSTDVRWRQVCPVGTTEVFKQHLNIVNKKSFLVGVRQLEKMFL